MSNEDRWEVRLSPTAERSLRRFPEKIAVAVVEFITVTLPEDPIRMSKPLHNELADWRVARRGHYRVLLQVLREERVLLIGRIDHRGNIYG